MVDGYEGELDVSEVLDGDNHVVEHHHLVAVDTQETLEANEGSQLQAYPKEKRRIIG